MRVNGGVTVELGGWVVGFGFGSGSRGHTGELRGLRVSLLDSVRDCNLARLNRVFHGAALSDSVWEAKLLANYQDLLDLLPPERYKSLSKKSSL